MRRKGQTGGRAGKKIQEKQMPKTAGQGKSPKGPSTDQPTDANQARLIHPVREPPTGSLQQRAHYNVKRDEQADLSSFERQDMSCKERDKNPGDGVREGVP